MTFRRKSSEGFQLKVTRPTFCGETNPKCRNSELARKRPVCGALIAGVSPKHFDTGLGYLGATFVRGGRQQLHQPAWCVREQMP
jgi:hypothetical protein